MHSGKRRPLLSFWTGFVCDLPAGLEGDTDVQFLLLGGELVKVRSTSWKKMRFFKLQEDCKTIWHESHKKFKRNQTCECGHLLAGLFASRPRCIRYGSRTPLFLAFKKKKKNWDTPSAWWYWLFSFHISWVTITPFKFLQYMMAKWKTELKLTMNPWKIRVWILRLLMSVCERLGSSDCWFSGSCSRRECM